MVDAHRFVVVVDATCEETMGWDTHHKPKFSSRPSAAEPLIDEGAGPRFFKDENGVQIGLICADATQAAATGALSGCASRESWHLFALL